MIRTVIVSALVGAAATIGTLYATGNLVLGETVSSTQAMEDGDFGFPFMSRPVVAFRDGCPDGWTEYTDNLGESLDDRYLVGTSNVGEIGDRTTPPNGGAVSPHEFRTSQDSGASSFAWHNHEDSADIPRGNIELRDHDDVDGDHRPSAVKFFFCTT